MAGWPAPLLATRSSARWPTTAGRPRPWPCSPAARRSTRATPPLPRRPTSAASPRRRRPRHRRQYEVSHLIVVTTAVDEDNGSADPSLGTGTSLREAINLANGAPGADTIDFHIPGAGVHTISLLSALPTITAPAIIDGYTQPGASPNTLAVGDNAVLLIELSGANAGIGVPA